MKKIRFLAAAALAVCLALALGGCGASLPDGMQEDEVKKAAEATVSQLAGEDYEGLVASMDEVMKASTTLEDWQAVWQPIAAQVGAFEKIESHALASKDGYAVDVVKVKYANAALTFTLSYNADYQLSGLYVK